MQDRKYVAWYYLIIDHCYNRQVKLALKLSKNYDQTLFNTKAACSIVMDQFSKLVADFKNG